MSELNPVRISPLLALIAEALDARNGPSQAKVGAALIELGQLARLHVPVRGVAPLSDDHLFNAIDSIAVKHLDLGAVRQAVDSALTKVEPLSSRDDIEVAVDHLCAVLNLAYFHAGLAFGVTLADLRSL